MCQYRQNPVMQRMYLHVINDQGTGSVWQIDYIGSPPGAVKYILVMVDLVSEVVLLNRKNALSSDHGIRSLSTWFAFINTLRKIREKRYKIGQNDMISSGCFTDLTIQKAVVLLRE